MVILGVIRIEFYGDFERFGGGKSVKPDVYVTLDTFCVDDNNCAAA